MKIPPILGVQYWGYISLLKQRGLFLRPHFYNAVKAVQQGILPAAAYFFFRFLQEIRLQMGKSQKHIPVTHNVFSLSPASGEAGQWSCSAGNGQTRC